MTRRGPWRDTTAAGAILALALALGFVVYDRMLDASGRARRAAELEQRLEAARELLAADLRRHGHDVPAAERGSPVSAPGLLEVVYGAGPARVVHRYRASEGRLELDDGSGAGFVEIAAGVEALDVAPRAAASRGALYTLALEGRDGDLARRLEAPVFAPNARGAP